MPLTVGTAGHIDHGKTWLVRALTGKDTDRLPEEQRRGISIDLGYAPLELLGRASAVAGRRAWARALRSQHGRRRDRNRPVSARARRRRRGTAPDARAPRDHPAARDRARRRRGDEGRCRRRGDARARARGSAGARPGGRGGRGQREDRRRARRASRRTRARGGLSCSEQLSRRRGSPLRRPRLLAARDRHGRDRNALVGDGRRGRRAPRRAIRTGRARAERPGARLPGRAGRAGAAGRARAARASSGASSGAATCSSHPAACGRATGSISSWRSSRRSPTAPGCTSTTAPRRCPPASSRWEASRSCGSRRPSSPRAATGSCSAARRRSAAAPCLTPHPPVTPIRRGSSGLSTARGRFTSPYSSRAPGASRRSGWPSCAARARAGDRRGRPARPGRAGPDRAVGEGRARAAAVRAARLAASTGRARPARWASARQRPSSSTAALAAAEPGAAKADDAELARFLERAGRLVRLGDGWAVSAAAYERARRLVLEECASSGQITLARFRDLAGCGRRDAQLLLERLDADGVTRRVGEARMLRRRAAPAAERAQPGAALSGRRPARQPRPSGSPP